MFPRISKTKIGTGDQVLFVQGNLREIMKSGKKPCKVIGTC